MSLCLLSSSFFLEYVKLVPVWVSSHLLLLLSGPLFLPQDSTWLPYIFQVFTQKAYSWLKSEQKVWIDIFLKKTCRWPKGTRKDAQHGCLSEKCKSKPPWGITSHLPEGPLLKRTQKTNFDEDVEKREHSLTFGGKVNWYSHCGKQYVASSKA